MAKRHAMKTIMSNKSRLSDKNFDEASPSVQRQSDQNSPSRRQSFRDSNDPDQELPFVQRKM